MAKKEDQGQLRDDKSKKLKGKKVKVRALSSIQHGTEKGVVISLSPGDVHDMPEGIAHDLVKTEAAEYVDSPQASHDAALEREKEKPKIVIPEDLHVDANKEGR